MDIDESDIYEKFMGLALRFVSYRPRSSQEIRQYLEGAFRRKHVTAPLVLEKIMARLTELGYIDDRAFVTWWVAQRTGRKPKGPQVIRSELRNKGIDRELIEEELAARLSGGETSERGLAAAAAQKRLPRLSRYPALERKAKLAQYLMRLGFSSDIVWGVVDEVIANV